MVDDIEGFAACLQTVFVNTGQVADWIGRLANHDVRRALQFTREIVASPHIPVPALVGAWVAKTSMSVDAADVKNAMIRGKYDIYFHGVQSFIQNLFNLVPECETTPLLPIRILQFLLSAWQDNQDNDNRYVVVTQLLDYFEAMDIDARATQACLDAMIKRGLCLSYDPTAEGIKGTIKVEIAPSGRQHLDWALRDWVYLEAMAETTPMYDQTVVDAVKACLADGRPDLSRKAIAAFVNYLIQEDSHYCLVPKHESYAPQEKAHDWLGQQVKALASFSSVLASGRYCRTTGRVKTWISDQAYGFIEPPDDGKDVFVNIADVIEHNGSTLELGVMVEYDCIDTNRGKKAVNVVVLT